MLKMLENKIKKGPNNIKKERSRYQKTILLVRQRKYSDNGQASLRNKISSGLAFITPRE